MPKKPAAVSEDDRKLDEIAAAEFLGVKRQTMAAWRCTARGPVFLKIGRAIRYRLGDLRQFCDARECNSTAQASQLEGVKSPPVEIANAGNRRESLELECD